MRRASSTGLTTVPSCTRRPRTAHPGLPTLYVGRVRGRVVRAAVCREFGAPLVIEDLYLSPPGPEEVRVALRACAVCHSDVSYLQGDWGGDLPAVWGHEAAGVVVEVGPGVAVEVGQHVVVTLVRSCGTCVPCRRGHVVACTTTFALDHSSPLRDADGNAVIHGMRTAAFAEQVVVHASQVIAVPQDVPFASAALLACGVLTGVGAVANTAAVEPGRSVVVVGCGGVGLNVVQGARLAGAAPIIGVDLEDSKLDAASAFGATHTVNPTVDDACTFIREHTDGVGADYVFVATGSGAAIESAFTYVASMGALVIVGMPPNGVVTPIDPGTLASRNQRILGSKMGSADTARDVPVLVSAYQQGGLLLDELVSGTYPLDRINDAIDGVRSGVARRNVIVFEPEVE